MRPTRSALLLDALGTIIALDPPAPTLRCELRQRFGIGVTEAQAERALAAEIAYYRRHLDEGRDAASLAGLRARCAEVLRSALPASERLDGIALAALTETLLASLRFKPFPDVRGALLAARERGERIVVVSNWDASLPRVLEQLELAPLLDGIVTSAEAGARKPDPAIFRTALERAQIGADSATHVGDSLEEDVHGAQAAGVEALLLRRDGAPGPSGVGTITSLADLA